MNTGKSFCVVCERLVNSVETECTRCKNPTVYIGQIPRFPKHPKKSDYEFMANAVMRALKYNRKRYNKTNDGFLDKINNFLSKYSSIYDKKVIDSIINPEEKEPQVSLCDFDSTHFDKESPDVFYIFKFLDRYAVKEININKTYYTSNISIITKLIDATTLTGLFTIKESELQNIEWFKTTKTNYLSKTKRMSNTVVLGSFMNREGDDVLNVYFEDKLLSKILASEMKLFVLKYQNFFNTEIVRQALEAPDYHTISRHFPEIMV